MDGRGMFLRGTTLFNKKQDICHERSLNAFCRRQTLIQTYCYQYNKLFQRLGPHSRYPHLCPDQLDGGCPVMHEFPQNCLEIF